MQKLFDKISKDMTKFEAKLIFEAKLYWPLVYLV